MNKKTIKKLDSHITYIDCLIERYEISEEKYVKQLLEIVSVFKNFKTKWKENLEKDGK